MRNRAWYFATIGVVLGGAITAISIVPPWLGPIVLVGAAILVTFVSRLLFRRAGRPFAPPLSKVAVGYLEALAIVVAGALTCALLLAHNGLHPGLGWAVGAIAFIATFAGSFVSDARHVS